MHSEIGKIASTGTSGLRREIDVTKRGEGGRGWHSFIGVAAGACLGEDVYVRVRMYVRVLGNYLVPLFQLLHLTVLVAQLGLTIL